MTDCFHCGDPIPAGPLRVVTIGGNEQPMCCPGCQAVAQSIVDAGLSSFYDYRTTDSDKTDVPNTEQLNELLAYDLQEVQQEFVATNSENHNETILTIDGIRCAACAWLIEHHVGQLAGVYKVSVNTTTHRVVVAWEQSEIKLSEILAQLRSIGYRATPFQPGVEEAEFRKQYQRYLIRLGIAGLATMQVMMFAIGLYFGVFSDLEDQFRDLLRWTSLIMATPVILYSALPFYRNALQGLKALQLNMDLPVSIALLLAYSSSAYATVLSTGEVYFESVSMFAFFLLLGRFLEMKARRRASETGSNLLKLLPAKANKQNQFGEYELVAASILTEGDLIRIVPGETIPADAIISTGQSRFDESMLTGESYPVQKSVGETIYAGSVNRDQIVTGQVLRSRNNSVLSDVVRLQASALQDKPKIAHIADAIAKWFVPGLLIISIATYIAWLQIDATEAFWITLSVLVATCPCALSLATPTAITCAYANLSRLGLLVRRGNVLEALSRVTEVIFDKTGTLTEGDLVVSTFAVATGHSENDVLSQAAALELGQQHPVAVAIMAKARHLSLPLPQVHDIQVYHGDGVTGSIEQRKIWLGRPGWLQENGISIPTPWLDASAVICFSEHPVGAFYVDDNLRQDTSSALQALQSRKIQTTILTGDDSNRLKKSFLALSLKRYLSGQRPADKLAYIRQKQNDGEYTLAVGDGVNDAPLLAAAHCSVAMGGGTDLAKVSADAILPSNRLTVLIDALDLSKRAMRITKQNLAWALAYNLCIIPLAVSGYIAPYFAALGMSLSSLLVVSNSLRLLNRK
ncbi:heavy metal translocating P-type ATPase [Corallincola holothuriorum]|uniref:heavy metal translocating P-type ATPase n=1 Tax=Corallincola holothuriorum TaxID=2282215 RepID=UPI0018F186DD|nr:heavy metal translocating P-type ATPase [Corallincola holothuriorum]